MRVVAIHQPNFFPWLGYFDKIRRADTFVFLDEVDYPRTGSKGMGSWTNRVKIGIQGEAHWFGCPIERLPSHARISEALISEQGAWRKKLLRTLEMNYARGPNFRAAMDLIRPLMEHPVRRLAEFNMHAIQTIADVLGFASTRFVRQSQLGTSAKGTELLIEIAHKTGCTTYLAGGGAQGYQEDALFARAGIELQYQSFVPRPYGDPSSFIPGLSIVDYLMKAEDWAAFPGSS